MGASSNHLNVVVAVKSNLLAAGVDLSGPCGAFEITKRVAWALKAEGAGLLDKPSGNNCDGFATDIVCYPDGLIYDCLGDGGGANTPQWPDDGEPVDAARYRPAVDPGDAPTPEPAPTPDPALESRVALLEAKVGTLQRDVDVLKQQQSWQAANLEAIAQRVTSLENAPAATVDVSTLYVEGGTSRDWGHVHHVLLPVRQKG